jgi:transcriptional regulator with XRE-family HTH domain
MYKTNLTELGNRLKEVRRFLGLSQNELAEKLDCNQGAISKLEVGKGSIKTFISLLTFYSQYIYINCIFAEKFYLISTDDKDVLKSNIDSIVSNIIKDSVSEYEKDTIQATKKMKKSLNKAIKLLNS